MRNKEWRKDLVKRYWVDNSGSSGGEDDGGDDDNLKSYDRYNNNSTTNILVGETDGFFEKPGAFKEEFFPIQIVKKKKMVNVDDKKKTFMYGMEEAMPEFFMVNKKEHLEIDYKF